MTDLPTADDRRWAAKAKRREETTLDEVRTIAEKWRNGLFGLAGVVTASIAAVSPFVGTQVAPSATRTVVGVLALTSVAALIVGVWLSMSASFGNVGYIANSGEALREASRKAAARAAVDLGRAKFLTILGLLALGTSAGVSLFMLPGADSESGPVRVTSGGQTFCGVISYTSSPGQIRLTAKDGTVRVLSLDNHMVIEQVQRC